MSTATTVPGRSPQVVGVHRDATHRFTKQSVDEIVLQAGLGVEGDAHRGATVQHLSRLRRDPSAPNLRQVHLLPAEVLDELVAAGFDVSPGAVGENVTTRGVDLLGLPTGARLHLGAEAVVEVTGLRNPCVQLDRYRSGLMKAVLARGQDGALVRRAGVMAVVVLGGAVRPGAAVVIELPDGPFRPLEPV